MSAKAFEALSKSSESELSPQTAHSQEKSDKENNEKIVAARKNLIRFGSLAVLAFVVWLFATIAWFSSNRATTAGGMSVTTSDMPFEIAAKGDTIRNSDVIASIYTDYAEGATMYVTDSESVTQTYYKTSSTIDKIKLRFDLIEDDPATLNINEDNNKSIGPGSCGVLELYVIPKKDGSVSANIEMNVVGYVNVEVDETVVDEVTNEETTTTVKKLMKVSELTTLNSGLTQEKIDNIKQAEKFLQGHIMFFNEENTVTTAAVTAVNGTTTTATVAYSYRSPCTNRTTVYNGTDLTANTPYYKPIYWMWPNTLGQIAVKDNSAGRRVGTPVVEETNELGTASAPTDKALVLQYLKDNKADVFKNLENVADLTEQQTTGKTQEEISALINTAIDTRIDSASDEDNFKKLSTGYNSADSDIGTMIDYFVIEITVTSGT